MITTLLGGLAVTAVEAIVSDIVGPNGQERRRRRQERRKAKAKRRKTRKSKRIDRKRNRKWGKK